MSHVGPAQRTSSRSSAPQAFPSACSARRQKACKGWLLKSPASAWISPSSLVGSSSSVSSLSSSTSDAGPSSSPAGSSSGLLLCMSVSHHRVSSSGKIGSPCGVVKGGRGIRRWDARSTSSIQASRFWYTFRASGCGLIIWSRFLCETGTVLSLISRGENRSRSGPVPAAYAHSFVTVVHRR